MTMSLPVSVPAPAASAKPATPPGKAVAAAHGAPRGKAEGVGPEDAAGVADMFAALVATLTAQMQPATEVATEVATELMTGASLEGGVPVPVDPTAIPLVLPTVAASVEAVVGEVVPDRAEVVILDGEGTPEVGDLVDGLEPTDGAPVDGVPVDDAPVDGDETADETRQGTLNRATPATPATPATREDGVTTPAQRATPAQPAHTVGDVLTGVGNRPTEPVAKDKAEPNATPVTAPSDRVARPERTERVTAPQAPARAADAHVQVARVVRPLRLGHDGAYELSLDLAPAELGRVRIDVELRGSNISLSMRADNPATRELLQSSLDQLRSELETAGLHAGNLDVGGRGTDGRDAPGQDQSTSSTQADSADESVVTIPVASDLTDLDATDGLDVRA